MVSNVEFREVLREEIEEVARLHNELVYFIQKETKDDYWDFNDLADLSEEGVNSYLYEFLNNPECKLYIAKVEDKIVGYIAGVLMNCHLPISSVKKVGYISEAYVMPDYRGIGVMKELEKLIVEFFRSLQLKYIELNFISNNSLARECWNSLGYTTFREQARKSI